MTNDESTAFGRPATGVERANYSEPGRILRDAVYDADWQY